MFANKHAKILIALVCAVLGFMLATQFKTTERQKTINIQRAEDLSDRLKAVEKERDELSKECPIDIHYPRYALTFSENFKTRPDMVHGERF